MTAPILVTGGTGTLGRRIVPLLRDAGCDLRILSRHDRKSGDGVEYATGDLVKNEGVEAAVTGAETVIHLAGGPKGDEIAARNLVAAASRASVSHLVFISVVNADRIPIGYYRQKIASEKIIADSGVPYTILRAAQFHELVAKVGSVLARLPLVPIPGRIRLQSVDSRDVAERMVELALGAPAGLVRDLVGPQVIGAGELIRGYLSAAGKRRLTMPMPLPGTIGRLYRDGANLALDGADVGHRTWTDFIDEQVRTTTADGGIKAAYR